MKATRYADGFATFLNGFKDSDSEGHVLSAGLPLAAREPSPGASVGKVLDVLKLGPQSIPELIKQSDLDVGILVDTVSKLSQVGLVQTIGEVGNQRFELTETGEQVASPEI